MSFGFGISDAITLISLAYSTYEGAKQACGQHDELTKEIYSHYGVLNHLHAQIADPDSLIHKARGRRGRELGNHIEGCERHLKRIDTTLKKYNALSSDEKGGSTLWEKLRFGIGGVKDIEENRRQMTTYSRALALTLQLYCMGSQGRMERQIGRLRGVLKDLREDVNLVIAKRGSTCREGSVSTDYSNDDRAFWRGFRRELVEGGYPSRVIRDYEGLIQAYVREVCQRGVLDEKSCMSQTPKSDLGDNEPSPNAASDNGKPLGNISNENNTNFVNDEAVQDSIPLASDPFENDEKEHIDSLLSDTHNSAIDPQSIETVLSNLPLPQIDEQSRSSVIEADGHPKAQRDFPNVTFSRERFHKVDLTNSGVLDKSDGFHRTLGTASNQSNISTYTGLATGLQYPIIFTKNSFQAAGLSGSRNLTSNPEYSEKTEAEEIPTLSLKDNQSNIKFRDTKDRKYLIPYLIVSTWENMHEFLLERFKDDEEIGSRVCSGRYDLYDKDSHIILPEFWESLIKPDMEISMEMWKETEEATYDRESLWKVTKLSTATSPCAPRVSRRPKDESYSTSRCRSRDAKSPFDPSQHLKNKTSRQRTPSPTPSKRSTARKSPPSILSGLWTRPKTRIKAAQASIPRYSHSASTYTPSPRWGSYQDYVPTWSPPSPPSPPLPQSTHRDSYIPFKSFPVVSYTTSYFTGGKDSSSPLQSKESPKSTTPSQVLITPVSAIPKSCTTEIEIAKDDEEKIRESEETQVYELEA